MTSMRNNMMSLRRKQKKTRKIQNKKVVIEAKTRKVQLQPKTLQNILNSDC